MRPRESAIFGAKLLLLSRKQRFAARKPGVCFSGRKGPGFIQIIIEIMLNTENLEDLYAMLFLG